MKRRLKKYFISGLVIFLPFVLTIYVSVWVLNFAENIFGRYLRTFFINNYDSYFWGLGIISLVALILLCGFVVTNYFGRAAHKYTENLVLQIPVIGSIYPAFKEIAGFLFRQGDQAGKPQQVVLVEWPRQGAYTIGFLTNTTTQVICDAVGQPMVNVLIPTVPNPLTGFIAMIPRDQIRILSLSVEEAVRMIVSGGVVDPRSGSNASGEAQLIEPRGTEPGARA